MKYNINTRSFYFALPIWQSESNVQCFLRSLVASAVLAHALVGCCAHDHGHSSEHGLSIEIASPHSCSFDQEHKAAADQHQQDSEPTSRDECGRCDCHWLTGGIAGIEIDFDGSPKYLCPSETHAVVESVSSTDWRDGSLVHSLYALGLRAHLAMSVMLL